MLGIFHPFSIFRWVLAVSVVGFGLSTCAMAPRIAYTEQQARSAQLSGFDRIRVYADADPEKFKPASEWKPQALQRELNILCISGGGAGGAFTAGILNAWTARGDRPNFDVVTGVSTGALIAPFAFLGPQYDHSLEVLYTGGGAEQLVDVNWRAGAIFGSSLLTGHALRSLVDSYVTTDLLEAVAAEHRKGRRLFVMTTNLDSQRAVIWNMGAIAASERPDAATLFKNVLLASASIPGIFPAVMIKATSKGGTIEEMHSDGGTSDQFFSLPDKAMLASGSLPSGVKKLHFYIIVNNALIPEFAVVKNGILPVTTRAYAILVKSQTKEALLALYNYSIRSGFDFNVASIDEQVPYSPLNPFDTVYMSKIFDLGMRRTEDEELWHDRPDFSP
ncbi:patatin-like phospholipase family protein [Rhizobium halophytocola]|uniref:PNPLA domain-containing protein n=1 Tax=Rhizobium halophytocola TaxID=735519 RepID=A0ABS4E4P7_9HYPH|nr:patatin-like phospholipase family protein [Rhizobium halophytocola]MBP1852874.1 hypothetical protein [Rhizobium halophytocola]